jgi:hypothetical protein
MLIQLIRNQPQGNAITGRLIIDGTFFCNTLERKGYQILALCYHVAVTQSPKFKRLLPIVQNVPNRSGIRIHRGTKPEHSTGCILVVADNPQPLGCVVPQRNVVENNVVDVVVNPTPVGCRSAAEIERELTSLILKAQQNHEEIILEVTDFRPGTEYGYNHPCPPELQQHAIDARRAAQRYNELCPTERHA